MPYVDRLIDEISHIDQASTQWTLADLFGMLSKDLSEHQLDQAKDILKGNLANHSDWIVLNQTMATLAQWSKKDEELKHWMKPHLQRLAADERKSVSKRAQKLLALFDM